MGPAPWTGAFLVGQTVAFLPAMLSAVPRVEPGDQATLQLLFLLAGFAALKFGYVVRMLEQFEAAEDAGEGPRRSVALPDRHPAAGPRARTIW